MPAVERYGLRSANEKGGRATGELVRCTTGAAACGVGLASPACCWKRSTMADVKWGTLAASEGSWALLHRTGGSLLQLERGAVWRVGWGALAKPGGSLQLCCTGRESLVRRWVCSITPTTDGGLTRRPKGAVGLLHQEGEPRPTLNRQGDSRRGWRIGWRAPSNRREPAALLHRGGGEPRPPQSMQHSSDDRRRAHPATGGSRGSAAPEGEPSPMLRKQRDVTDGGTLTASEGSCGSAAPEGRVPLFSLMQGAVLARRKKGSRYNRREPAALLHREWEPRPPPSTQRNSKWRTEASHCDRREPWVCCTGRESPVRRRVRSMTPATNVGLTRCDRRELRLCFTRRESPVRHWIGKDIRGAVWLIGWRAPMQPKGASGSAAPKGEPRPMLKMQGDATDGGTLTASEGSCGSAAPEGRVPLAA